MTKLVYIGGYGRSGSTLLEALLTSSPRFVACGETVNALNLKSDRICSCGRRSSECPVWGPLLASPELPKQTSHVDLDVALLKGILASKRTMIDSSKTAWGGFRSPFRLRRVLGEDFELVHLVRDPRAVCWSIVRAKSRRAERNGVRLNVPRVYIEGALGWSAANLACELFGRRYPKQYRRVRYEDLVRAPRETLGALFAAFQLEAPEDIIEANAADNQHQLFGNTARRKPISLAGVQEDTEWREAMPLAYRRLVGALSTVLRDRYSYT